MRRPWIVLFSTVCLVPACAQWKLQKSPTTADLFAVHGLDGRIAWASGTQGTVIRTEDGENWQACSTPKGTASEALTGIQALDANTAIVMTSGKGEFSRLYKTTDGCKTWKLVFTNPDADGAFVSLRRVSEHQLWLLGQPVDGKFAIFSSRDAGDSWYATDDPGLAAGPGDVAFASSNSTLWAQAATLFFAIHGNDGPALFYSYPKCDPGASVNLCPMAWGRTPVTSGAGAKGTEIASVAGRMTLNMAGKASVIVVAVGGDPQSEGAGSAFAAFSIDGGKTWQSAHAMPRGYRSALAFDIQTRTWIAVGKDGTDISKDNGGTWAQLQQKQDAGSDAGWRALSPPFAVGAHGQIGILNGR